MNFLTRFSDFVREFEFPSFEQEFNEIESTIKKHFDKVKEKFKNLTDNFTIEIPFDRGKGQELASVSVCDNRLVVEIVSRDAHTHVCGRSMTTHSIPQDVDVTSMRQIYDEENKRILFIFGKKNEVTTEQPTTSENVEETSETVETTQETVETTEEVVAQPQTKKDSLMRTILAMYENGCSYRRIAAETGISDKTVKRWIQSALREE